MVAACPDHPVDPDELVERLGLGAVAGTRYAKLSGGQQQRLAIATALVGRPRVVLLDELTTGLDPEARRQTWDLVRDVRDAGTTFATGRDVTAALEAGATGYVLEDTPAAQLVAALRAAVAGESVLSPAVATQVVSRLRGEAEGGLTERELGVLRLVAQGTPNRTIAASLFISEATVKTHLGHVFGKLGATDRAAAVASAYERGILP